MSIHTDFRKGQRIVIHLKDGSFVVGKYRECKGRKIVLYDSYVNLSDIKSTTIYKHQEFLDN